MARRIASAGYQVVTDLRMPTPALQAPHVYGESLTPKM